MPYFPPQALFLRHTVSASAGGRNILSGSPANTMVAGADVCTILGGGTTADPNVISGPSGASLNLILGGYDNDIAGVIANGIINSFHSVIQNGVTHGFIGGGSTLSLLSPADYAVALGGLSNNVSGDYATAMGGTGNTASGNGSVAFGGVNNIASGTQAIVGGSNSESAGSSSVAFGASAKAYGLGTVALGGSTNTVGASGTPSFADYSAILAGFTNAVGVAASSRFSGIVAGRANTINAEYCAIVGGHESTLTTETYQTATGYRAAGVLYGSRSHANGHFAAVGDAQIVRLTARRETTNGTGTVLFLDGSAKRLVLPNLTSWAFSILINARRTDSAQYAAYRIEGLIHREANAAATTLSAHAVTVLHEDDAAWNVACTADTSNGALTITATGAIGATIRWVADVTIVQVGG